MEEQFNNNLLPATSMLPIEVWSGIFEKLKTTPKTLVSCREVCVEFKNEIDKKLRVRLTELDHLPLTIEEAPVRKLPATRISGLQSATEFEEKMRNHGGNPFPTQKLSFHPRRCDCTNFCNVCLPEFKDPYLKCFQLSKRHGNQVHGLELTVVDRSSLVQMKKVRLQNFPNLRQLEIKMVKANDGLSWWKYGQTPYSWLNNFKCPPLAHFSHLKLYFYNVNDEMVMIKPILNSYGHQIKALTVTILESTSSFGNVTVEVLPNLTNLKVQFMPDHGHTHVANFLLNGNWPLKQLTLLQVGDFRGSIFKFQDLIEILSRFSSTLQILHLYFTGLSHMMCHLNSLSESRNQPPVTPDEIASRLQLSVKLPLLQELSMLYGCIRRGMSATSKLCEKFENLKTLHIGDDGLKDDNYIMPDYELELNANWWPILSPSSKLERVIIFSGNEVNEDVTVHQVINKPAI